MSEIQVQLQEWMGSDKSIADAAWTSSTSTEGMAYRTPADVVRVVNMLADQGHSTPFESVVLRFWLRIPIATDRQIMTHRLQSSNGLSGRYRSVPSDFHEMPDDVLAIAQKAGLGDSIPEKYAMHCTAANSWYEETLANAKEQRNNGLISSDEYKRLREFVRGALPQHNYTERTTVMNLRSWANFLRLRLAPSAQPEIREVARQMLQQVTESDVCPFALAALARNEWRI